MEDSIEVNDNRTVWVYTCFNRKSSLAPMDVRNDTLKFHNDILVHGGAVQTTFGRHRFLITQWKNRYIIEAINEEAMRDFVYITDDGESWDGVDIFQEIPPTFEIGINDKYELMIHTGGRTMTYNEYDESTLSSGYSCNIL